MADRDDDWLVHSLASARKEVSTWSEAKKRWMRVLDDDQPKMRIRKHVDPDTGETLYENTDPVESWYVDPRGNWRIPYRKDLPPNPERAVLVIRQGVLLYVPEWVGPAISYAVDVDRDDPVHAIKVSLNLNGLDGIFIFEGTSRTQKISVREGFPEYDNWLEGNLRPINDEDSRSLRDTGSVFYVEDWIDQDNYEWEPIPID